MTEDFSDSIGTSWADWNNRELDECNISSYARKFALPLFVNCAEKMKRFEMQADGRIRFIEFFGKVKGHCEMVAKKQLNDAVLEGDMKYVHNYGDILHALDHFHRYAIAHSQMIISRSAFREAVNELLGSPA